MRLVPWYILWPYDYDANSNRTQKAVDSNITSYQVASNSNRLNSIASNAQSYDATGNLTSNGTLQFSYDAAGRLVQAQTSTGLYRYGVNAHGQRVSKTGSAYLMPTPSTYYVYDESGHLIGEYDTGGARIQEHIWLNDQPIAVIDASGNVYYALSDHLNTPRQIIDSNQQLRWRWDATDPFGANLANNNPSTLGSFTYNLRFPGQYFDSETGLHYNYFRDYDPASGRYIESDPVGLRGGLNTYGYVGGNPDNFVDRLGLDSVLIFQTEPDFNHGQAPDSWNLAASYAGGQALKNCSCKPEDIHVLPVTNVGQVNSALSSFQDISMIYFIGHAASHSIYVGGQSLPDTNISSNGGVNDHSPSNLNWANLKPGATINIWGCHAGFGSNSIAQQLANISGATTIAPSTFLNFSEITGAPFIHWWRPGSWNTFSPKPKQECTDGC